MLQQPFARQLGKVLGEPAKNNYIARQRAYAYNEHFYSPVNIAMSMFKLSITPRWALMVAHGWARFILDRRRDWINDRPNRATAAESPLDEAQERCHFDNPMTHTRGACQHREAAKRTSFALYFFLLMTKHRPSGTHQNKLTLCQFLKSLLKLT